MDEQKWERAAPPALSEQKTTMGKMYKHVNDTDEPLETIIAAQAFTDETLRVLNKKIWVPDGMGGKKDVELIPKRRRWDCADPIRDFCTKLLGLLRYANALAADDPELAAERYRNVCRAYAIAKDIAGAMNDTARRLNLSFEHFKEWERLYNVVMMPLLAGWQKSERKRALGTKDKTE